MNGTGNVAGTLTGGNVGRFTPLLLCSPSVLYRAAVLTESIGQWCRVGLSYPIEARGTASNVLRNYDSGLVSVGNLASLSLVAENANSGADLSLVSVRWASTE